MSRFLNEKYLSFDAYTPGEQPQDMQYIKLNTNESPYPPAPEVFSAVNAEELGNLRLYPDPQGILLKEKLAQTYGVNAENVFLSNGSDDILNFAFMAFCSDSCRAVFPDITYGFYEVFANLHGVKYTAAPLDDKFEIDINDYLNVKKTVVIANPNAPTGIFMPLDAVEKIVKSNPDNVVLIDEAYIDFGAQSCAALTKKYDNLLVVQTYSKSRSMAGARLGFAIASKAIIDDLEKIKYSTNPYNINRLTLAAGAAALDAEKYYSEKCRKIADCRVYTTNELKKLGFDVLNSSANFVFAKSSKISGERFYVELKKRGILVRHFTAPRICDFNRITIGTKSQMETFIKTAAEILS